MENIGEMSRESESNSKRRKISEIFHGNVKNYCESSSIHGLRYLVSDITWWERIWWIMIIFVCISGCSIMIFQIFDKWITTPVLISLATKETPIFEIPFPAVTVCPESKISTKCVNYTKVLLARKSGFLHDTTYQENKYFDYMALLCRAENHDLSMQIMNENNLVMSTEELLGRRNYPKNFQMDDFSEFLSECASINFNHSLCEWMGIRVSCQEIMSPIITDEGLCYTFNMLDAREIYRNSNFMGSISSTRTSRNSGWDPDWGYSKQKDKEAYPRRAYRNGADNSFIAVFFTRKDELDYACRDFNLQGIRVSLNIPTRIPRVSQVFFSVGLNSITTAAVLPVLTSVSPKIRSYEPNERLCYFSSERNLKYFEIYSQGNCNLECWTNYTIQYCGCVSFYMPRDQNSRLCSLQERYCLEEARVNYPAHVLSEKLWNINFDGTSVTEAKCNCLPLCYDLSYNTEIANSAWDFGNEDEAASDYDRDLVDKYYASSVRIFFKDNYFLPAEKNELYGVTDVISDCGGVLGLFIGFSLFSIAEIIYFLIIRLIQNQ